MITIEKIFLSFFLIICCLSVKGQKNNKDDFYSSLKKGITYKKSLELSTTEYLCLGEQNNWKVILRDNGENTNIHFYSTKNLKSNSKNPEFYLDTVYNVSKKELLQNIDSEKKEIESRLILTEAEHHILMKINNTPKELITRKMSGLYYIFRYHKTYEMYFE